MRIKHVLPAAALAVAAALSLSACGSESSSEQPAAAATTAAVPIGDAVCGALADGKPASSMYGTVMAQTGRTDSEKATTEIIRANCPAYAPHANPLDVAASAAGGGASTTDDGKTLVLDGKGRQDATGVEMMTIAAVLASLNVPESVTAHMDSTRALDGQQTDSWSTSEGTKVNARWTYHPDSGMNLILTTPDVG